jgi:type I restriction enzyme S subunit
MNADTLLENFEILAEAPGGIARLHSLVLSLAMSGQLVQRDSDWVEERLGECVVLRNGRAYSQTELLDTGTPVIRIQNLNGGKNWYYSNLDLPPEKLCEDGDLLFAWSASFGPYIWSGPTAIFHYHIWKIEVGPQLHKEFLFYLLQHLTEEIKKSSHGLAMLHMTKKKMENLVVSFPSVSEQLRVVDKVREIFLLCEELEAAQNQRNSIRSAARKSATDAISTATTPEELEAAWKRINKNWEVIADSQESVESLRKLILDLAVNGELVSQEETIEVHLRSEIEGPFQLPDSWRWELITSITSDLGQEVPKSEFQYIDVGSINSKAGRISEEISLLNPEDAPSRARKLVKKGTVLYSTVRPYLRNIAIVEKDFNPKAIASTAFAVLHPSDQILSGYLFVCVRSSYFTHFVESKQKGVAYPAINAGDLKMAMIPLPPVAEQKRIIAKVDELMALCDQLESELKSRSEVAEKFARSVVSAA